MTLYARQQRNTDVKNTLLDSVGEGKGRMIWEDSIETCILPYLEQITSPSSKQERVYSKPVHWDNPEGWDGEGGGRGFSTRDTCTPVADSCQCIAKTNTIL